MTWVCYEGFEGSIFYLAGPQAPMPGAQNGLVLQSFSGLMAPFTNLELRGAHQDGATWTDAVYDTAEIDLHLELTGTDPQSTRNVMRSWIGAWDPKQLGKLSVFTPDAGEWYANVRLGKTVQDTFSKDYTFSGRQTFIWSASNYDAFWYGPDSVATVSTSTSQTILVADNPVGSFLLQLADDVTEAIPVFSPASVVQEALEALENIGTGNVNVTATNMPGWTEYVVDFVGDLAGTVVQVLSADLESLIEGTLGIELVNQNLMPLTNIGDQPAWPRFLLYGPGTFSFSNGPAASSTSTITFGPLTDGQVVLLTTDPRLQSVVDLTPTQTSTPAANLLSEFTDLLESLQNFVFNNNVPPLLEEFESLFGILPPQGNLYALLNGRFTNPLAPAVAGVAPVEQNIAVSIANGNANSKIIGAVTPRRRWPL